MSKQKNQNEEENQKQTIDLSKDDWIFTDPESVDAIIKARLASTTKKGGRNDKSNKWTEKEIQLRHFVIWEYITKMGLSRTECARQLVARWGVHLNSAYRYIAEAMDSICIPYEEGEEEYRRMHLDRLENILQYAMEVGSTDTALKTLDQIAKINGLYTEKKQVDLKSEEPIVFKFQ